MTCAEFEAVLPDFLEGSSTTEQHAHVRECRVCSSLVSDITLISHEARLLRASDEPNPRVWNSLLIALQQEGLVHDAKPERMRSPSNPFRRWTLAWFLPATAAFLVTLGVLHYEHPVGPPQVAQQSVPAPAVVAPSAQPAAVSSDFKDDQQLLDVVGARSPALRSSYATELRDVNQYIQDAERSAKAHPGDEAAQVYLMNAYEEKAMVYELAMDRSLP